MNEETRIQDLNKPVYQDSDPYPSVDYNNQVINPYENKVLKPFSDGKAQPYDPLHSPQQVEVGLGGVQVEENNNYADNTGTTDSMSTLVRSVDYQTREPLPYEGVDPIYGSGPHPIYGRIRKEPDSIITKLISMIVICPIIWLSLAIYGCCFFGGGGGVAIPSTDDESDSQNIVISVVTILLVAYCSLCGVLSLVITYLYVFKVDKDHSTSSTDEENQHIVRDEEV